MKKIKYFFVAGFSALFFGLVSCAKDEVVKDKVVTESKTITYGNCAEQVEQPQLLFKSRKSISKGFVTDYSGSQYDTMFSTVKDNAGNTYKIMKVWRTSNPNKYFWIMIENFRYAAGKGCYLYRNDASEVNEYGRLYHWETANDCGGKIHMDLPYRKASGKYTKKNYTTYGHLPTKQDISDLMEIPNFQRGGLNEISGLKYYDVFLVGRDKTDIEDDFSVFHSIAGYMDNTDYPYSDFDSRHNCGMYWMQEGTRDAHQPLRIEYDDDNYTAYYHVWHHNHYAMSVRYVFEPKQL